MNDLPKALMLRLEKQFVEDFIYGDDVLGQFIDAVDDARELAKRKLPKLYEMRADPDSDCDTPEYERLSMRENDLLYREIKKCARMLVKRHFGRPRY